MSRRRLFGLLVCTAFAMSAVSACGIEQEVPGPSGESPALAGGGECSVSLTGDVGTSWKQQQTAGTLLVSQWLSPSERQAVTLAEGQASFIFNCEGGTGSISFILGSGTTEQQFPEAPGEYVIAAGGVGATPTSGQMVLLVNLHDRSSWSVSEPGIFRITSFGNSKLAGSFDAKLNQTNEQGVLSGTATITGTFNLGCTGSRCH